MAEGEVPNSNPKKESGRKNMYKPYFEVIEPFHKRSKSDNGENGKAKGDTEAPPQ